MRFMDCLLIENELRIPEFRHISESTTALVEVKMNVEKISAIMLRVANMRASARFYRDIVGMETVFGGEDGCFSSLCVKDAAYPIST